MDHFPIDDTGLPCTAAGIAGVFVPEVLEIIDVCQDPNNLSIVYLECAIQGVFAYTPTLTITYGSNTVNVDSQYIPKYNEEGVENFPIDTGCASTTALLAYDIGAVIPEFASLTSFKLTLRFNGSSETISENEVIADTFQSANPEATKIFTKGLTPQPYTLYYDANSNKIKLQYIGLGSTPCLCAINCVEPTADDFDFPVCEDEVQEVSIDANSIIGDPTNVTITFQDTIGNQSVLNTSALVNMEPLAPQVIYQNNPAHIQVGFGYVSRFGTKFNKEGVAYQILKYENSINNAKVWKDWSTKQTTNFVDTDVKLGNKYGYSIRFKGQFGEDSLASKWTEVKIY